RRAALALCLAAPLLAMSCPPRMKVHLDSASARNAPSFTFSREDVLMERVREFGVYACRPKGLQKPLWVIRPDSGTAAVRGSVLRVTYGEVPPGYVAETPALPLEPRKCYEAAVVGSEYSWPGTRDFYLERDGRVRALRGETSFELAMKQEQRWHRAAVGCRRGYRRARSAGDSAVVDARTFPVADTTLTCGWMREAFPSDIDEAISSERGTVMFLGLVAIMAGMAAGLTALDRTLGTNR
ncbi:MAG TPA: hypothetical protein VFS20_26755, partial [Longimicrobium sp.]|nr:hypothetical protein [Longimicrobium sp.]